MKRAWIFLLAAALTAPALAGHRVVDLGSQFPDAPCRAQGDTESCHAFSDVALLEAALWRRHRLKLPLSEADLFLRRSVASPHYYQTIRRYIQYTPHLFLTPSFDEGNDAVEGLAWAVEHGVATADLVSWSGFEKKYEAYRSGKTRDWQERLESCRGLKATAELLEKTQGDSMAATCASLRSLSNLSLRAFLDQAILESGKAEELLLDDLDRVRQDRGRVAELLAGFSVGRRYFGYPKKPVRDSRERCREAGAAQRRAITARLDAMIPVGVSMEITGLEEWRGQFGSHGFVLTGYAADRETGRKTFWSRNSWGGVNPDVPEDRLCFIQRVYWVQTDQE